MRNCTLVILILGFLLKGCTHDSYESLHPKEANTTGNVCDTTVAIRYNADIKPIIVAQCQVNNNTCHAATNISGYDFTTHAGLANAGNSGILVAAITHTGSASQMPKSGGKLDACSIGKIRRWVQSGALNN